jgi:hypothetical protein
VRVVSGGIAPTRSLTTGSSSAGLVPVLTYRGEAPAGTLTEVTNGVGGRNPAAADAGSGTTGAAFDTASFAFTAGASGTAHAVSAVRIAGSTSSVASVNFGFSYSVVVNTNDAGQGSLRQFLLNANALSNSGLSQSGLSSGIENAVFMIPNGTGAAGLRASLNYFAGGVATVAPASALPTVTDPAVVDATRQPGWWGTPVVELNGAGAGASANGLSVTAAGSRVSGFAVNRFGGSGVRFAASNDTLTASYVGLNAAGTAASANGAAGVLVAGGTTVVIGSLSGTRNVISGNGTYGVQVAGGSARLLANYIGTNAAGTGAVANALAGVYLASAGNDVGSASSYGAGNVISGNGQYGVHLAAGGGASAFAANYVGLNAAAPRPCPTARPASTTARPSPPSSAARPSRRASSTSSRGTGSTASSSRPARRGSRCAATSSARTPPGPGPSATARPGSTPRPGAGRRPTPSAARRPATAT